MNAQRSDAAFDLGRLEAALARLAGEPIARTQRGFLGVGPVAADQLIGTSVERLNLPLAVIDVAALDHNIALMADFCESAGVAHAPHAKTSMSPQIFGRQLRAGAWGLTVANVTQAEVCTEHGANRVIIANEVVDQLDIAWLARNAGSGTEVVCFVDTLQGVERLSEGLRQHRAGGAQSILVEVGEAGHRAGSRTVEDAVAIATKVRQDPRLALRGVAGFEGVLAHGRSQGSVDRVDGFCQRLLEVASAVEPFVEPGDPDEPMVVSAGGSVYFDVVADRLLNGGPRSMARRVILRSGAYVTHDHGYLSEASPLAKGEHRFLPSIEVRGSVLSVQDRTTAIVAVGKRDIGTDVAPPTALRARRGSEPWQDLHDINVTAMYDQHAQLVHSDGKTVHEVLQVGDIVGLGIAHPCTTFDRWRFIPLVKGDVVVEIARTFF